MPYIMENLVQYDLSEDGAQILSDMNLIFSSPEREDKYEITAFVWEELGIEGDRAFDLFDVILRHIKTR